MKLSKARVKAIFHCSRFAGRATDFKSHEKKSALNEICIFTRVLASRVSTIRCVGRSVGLSVYRSVYRSASQSLSLRFTPIYVGRFGLPLVGAK